MVLNWIIKEKKSGCRMHSDWTAVYKLIHPYVLRLRMGEQPPNWRAAANILNKH
jgi:hypothetical protein